MDEMDNLDLMFQDVSLGPKNREMLPLVGLPSKGILLRR